MRMKEYFGLCLFKFLALGQSCFIGFTHGYIIIAALTQYISPPHIRPITILQTFHCVSFSTFSQASCIHLLSIHINETFRSSDFLLPVLNHWVLFFFFLITSQASLIFVFLFRPVGQVFGKSVMLVVAAAVVIVIIQSLIDYNGK